MSNNLNNKGFTLVEILIVLAVTGVLAGIGTGSFVKYAQSQKISQAALEVKTAIEKAKFSAISRVKPGGCGTNPLQTFRFIVRAHDGNEKPYALEIDCGGTVTIIQEELPEGLKFKNQNRTCDINFEVIQDGSDDVSWTTTGNKCKTAYSSGSINCNDLTQNACIEIQGYGLTRTIVVDKGGNVMVYE